MNSSPAAAVGLSIGHASLSAVTSNRTAQRPLRRPPTVMRAGLAITDIVDRVGDPVAIVAADGSRHHGADLLAGCLHDLQVAAAPGGVSPVRSAVAYPSHWGREPVAALRRALSGRLPDATLLPDHEAAVAALRARHGLPAEGVVAVCDFGAGGTTVTLVDGGTRLGESRHCTVFSGDLLDQALLAKVMADAGPPAGTTGTSAIGPLARLRAECRAAKERLSEVTATAVPVGLAGSRGDVRITRPEVTELVRRPLEEVMAVVEQMLRDNGIAPARLAAVASVGGGAAIPAVTAGLSQRFRVPLVTAGSPALISATGAALIAAAAAAQAPPTTRVRASAPAPAPLAWSEAVDSPQWSPPETGVAPSRLAPRRPALRFESEPEAASSPRPRRRLLPVVVAVLLVAGAGVTAAQALRGDSAAAPVVPTPAGIAPARPEVPEPARSDPPPRTVVAIPAQAPEPAYTPAPVADPAPPPTAEPTPEPLTPVESVTPETVTAPPPTPAPITIPVPVLPVLSQLFPLPTA